MDTERVLIKVESRFEHRTLEVDGEYDLSGWFARRLYRAGRAVPAPEAPRELEPPKDDDEAEADTAEAEPVDED